MVIRETYVSVTLVMLVELKTQSANAGVEEVGGEMKGVGESGRKINSIPTSQNRISKSSIT